MFDVNELLKNAILEELRAYGIYNAEVEIDEENNNHVIKCDEKYKDKLKLFLEEHGE